MKVSELWRYPVKSMAGEALQSADLSSDGITGDRLVQVESHEQGLITSRTHPRLLLLRARVGPDGEPQIEGRSWKERASADAVRAAAGPDAILVPFGERRFDVLPLMVATDGAVAAFGYDRRRLRPNILISGVNGLDERQWPGCVLRIGESRIGVHSLRARCVMTTFDPDTVIQDREVLRKIGREFGGRLALNCWVIETGTIHRGDEVELIRP